MSSNENLSPEQRAKLVKVKRALRLAVLYQLGALLQEFSGDLYEVTKRAFADPGNPTDKELEEFFSEPTAGLLHAFLVESFERLFRFVPILEVGSLEMGRVPVDEMPAQNAPGTPTGN